MVDESSSTTTSTVRVRPSRWTIAGGARAWQRCRDASHQIVRTHDRRSSEIHDDVAALQARRVRGRAHVHGRNQRARCTRQPKRRGVVVRDALLAKRHAKVAADNLACAELR
jgi:hypothetical protein